MLAVAVCPPGFGPTSPRPGPCVGWAAVLLCATLLALNRKRLHRSPLHLRVIDTLVAVVLATARDLDTITLLVLAQGLGRSRRSDCAARLPCGGVRRRRSHRSHPARAAHAPFGLAGSRALIVGAGHVGRRLAKRLNDYPEFGLRPIGFLDRSPSRRRRTTSARGAGASWDFDRVVREQQVEDVVFTFSTAPADVYLRLMKRCQELRLRTSVVPRLYEKATRTQPWPASAASPRHESCAKPEGVGVRDEVRARPGGRRVVLALLAPLFGIFAFAVLLSLGRPIFYRQERSASTAVPSEC